MRRLFVLITLVAALAAAFSACAGPPDARLAGPSPALEDDDSVEIGAGELVIPETTAPPTTAVQKIERAESQEQICTGAADAFVPELDGYTVSSAGDVTASLPAGAPGIESVGAVAATSDDGRKAAIAVIVASAETVDEPIVQSSLDALTFAIGGVEDLAEQDLEGFLVLGGKSSKGTVLIWQQCKNVFVSVVAADADMARDIALQILS